MMNDLLKIQSELDRRPKQMRLTFSNDQFINITIRDFKKGGLSKFNKFNPSPIEIINLYE